MTLIRYRKVGTFRQYDVYPAGHKGQGAQRIGRVQDEQGRGWCAYDDEATEVTAHQRSRNAAARVLVTVWEMARSTP